MEERDHDIAATNEVETNELGSVNATCDTTNNIITGGNNNIADDEMYPEVEIKESFGKEYDHDIAATNEVETNELDSVNANCDTTNNIIILLQGTTIILLMMNVSRGGNQRIFWKRM